MLVWRRRRTSEKSESTLKLPEKEESADYTVDVAPGDGGGGGGLRSLGHAILHGNSIAVCNLA